MDQFSDLAAFVAVFETRSFSAAGRRLRLTTAGVSKSVIRLETRLGVRLFTRTTRRVQPTAEGEAFYSRARDILDQLTEAETEVSGGVQGLSGEVRICAPVLIGQQVLAPLLAELRRSHPLITLDLRLSDSLTNLIEEGIDLALRLGDLKDSRLVARRAKSTRFLTCASPAYLEKFGAPDSIDALQGHSCVTYVVQGSGKPFPWRFHDHSEFVPERSVLVGDGGANRACAIAGLGIIQDIDIALRPDLVAGNLTEIFAESTAPGPPLSIVQPAGRFVPRRVRAVAEYLAAVFVR